MRSLQKEATLSHPEVSRPCHSHSPPLVKVHGLGVNLFEKLQRGSSPDKTAVTWLKFGGTPGDLNCFWKQGGKGDALPPPPRPGLPGELSAQAPGTCGSWSREHRVGIGRRIIYVSRIYESFSVQIAVLVSSVGKLLWLLKLEQKRESRNSCHFSLLGGLRAFGDVLLFSNSCGVLSLIKKNNE